MAKQIEYTLTEGGYYVAVVDQKHENGTQMLALLVPIQSEPYVTEKGSQIYGFAGKKGEFTPVVETAQGFKFALPSFAVFGWRPGGKQSRVASVTL